MHPPSRMAPRPSRPAAAIEAAAALTLLLAILAGAAGCGGGGGGSSGPTSSDVNGVASNVEASPAGEGQVAVSFRLSTPVAKDVGVRVDYSQDRGLSWSRASLRRASAEPAALPADPGGVSHSVTWRASTDLEDLQQSDLRVRITPYDASTRDEGIPGRSGVFGLGEGDAPVVSGIEEPDDASGGWIAFDYTVADADADHVGLDGEYSLDGGSTWREARLGRGDGADAVTAPPGGAEHRVCWHAQGDVPESLDGSVRIRLRAVDTEAGPWAVSGDFAIDTRAPVIDLFTVEGIPAAMNGSLPYTSTAGREEAFRLLVADRRAVVWVGFLEGGSAIDSDGLTVTSSDPLGGGSSAGGVDAGDDIGERFAVDLDDGEATLTIGSSLAFPAGVVTLTARIRDRTGNVSDPVSFTFEAGPATPDRRPFDTPERWHLDFRRDNYAISSTTSGSGTVSMTATAGGNGTADFVEDLRVLGLQSSASPTLNALVLAAVKEAVMGRLNELYGRDFDGSQGSGAAITFSLSAPAAPYSRIGIGGEDPVPGYTIGRAEFDYRNSSTNDDSDADLGVFTTNLIDFYINSSFAFRSRFDPLVPGRGTPLGLHAADPTVLDDSFDRDDSGNTASENHRYDDLAAAIDGIARVTAVILAHEIGHSLGLVANGAPPAGLFGGESLASFAGPYTSAYHLDTVANDIMAASLSFSGAIATGGSVPRFTELTMAYLLEKVLLD